MPNFFEQQVDFIIGPFTSSMAAVIAPAVNQANIPILVTTVTSTEFTGKRDAFGDEISNAVHFATQVVNQQYKTLTDLNK